MDVITSSQLMREKSNAPKSCFLQVQHPSGVQGAQDEALRHLHARLPPLRQAVQARPERPPAHQVRNLSRGMVTKAAPRLRDPAYGRYFTQPPGSQFFTISFCFDDKYWTITAL